MATEDSKTLTPRPTNMAHSAVPPPELSLGELSLTEGKSKAENPGETKDKSEKTEESKDKSEKTEEIKLKLDKPTEETKPSARWADESPVEIPKVAPSEELQAEEEEEKVEPADFIPQPQVAVPKGFEVLPHCTSFEDLNLKPEIIEGLQTMRIYKPSVIQQCVLPYLLDSRKPNVIAQSQSGSGKTAAFALNILQRVDTSINGVQAVIIAPVRELAFQLYSVVATMGKRINGLKVGLLVSQSTTSASTVLNAAGEEIPIQTDLNSHVLVATSGVMSEKMNRRAIKLDNIKVLVLDEADTMLDLQGQAEQCVRIKGFISRIVKTGFQITLFSATFPEKVLTYAEKFAPGAVAMTLPVKEQAVKSIIQLSLMCKDDDEKTKFLVNLYDIMTVASSIVFVKTRKDANSVCSKLQANGHKVTLLTGELQGEDRDKALADFRQGATKVLIATNVIARGIDVDSVSLVINYNVPVIHRITGRGPSRQSDTPDTETYIHRVGRTGRFGRTGVAVTLLTKDTAPLLKQITDPLGVTVEELPADNWDEVEERITKVLKSKQAQAGFRPEGFSS